MEFVSRPSRCAPYLDPIDAWIIEEMITHLRPQHIVETRLYLGGCTFFLASIGDLLNHREVINWEVNDV